MFWYHASCLRLRSLVCVTCLAWSFFYFVTITLQKVRIQCCGRHGLSIAFLWFFSGGFFLQMFWGPGLQHRSRPLFAPFETRRQDSVRRPPTCWADMVAGLIEKDHKDISFYGLIVIYRCFGGRERRNFYSSSWAVLMIVACKCFSVLQFIILSDNYQDLAR